MKYLLLFLLTITPVCLAAQTRKQIKYAEKFDVLKYLPRESDGNPATFWKAITQNNVEFQELMKKFENPKGNARKAKEKVEKDAAEYKFWRELRYKSDNDKEVDLFFRNTMFGEGKDYYGVEFYISGDQDWNAFSSYDGFININAGLVNIYKNSNTMLIGVLAHEIGHYMYKHILVGEYKTMKRETTNNIIAAVGVASAGIANIAAAAQGGVVVDSTGQSYIQMIEAAKESTDNFMHRYNREEETEADIIAYRFLEWVGLFPARYIDALKKTDRDYMLTKKDKKSDHPTTASRIELLMMLEPAPWAPVEDD